MSRLLLGAGVVVASAIGLGLLMGPREAEAVAEPVRPGIGARAAEDVARASAERLGFPAVLGASCASLPGEPTARCQVRVHEEPASHGEGDVDVAVLHWFCNATGCYPASGEVR